MEQSRTILVIDDDPDVLAAVGSDLAGQNYRVVKAAIWTEAIAQLQDARPDAVLLDLRLPTVQGETLLEFIRETRRELPVIIISADVSPAEMGRLSDLGASGFIRKPFQTDDLMVVLEQVLLDLETVSVAAPAEREQEAPARTSETSKPTESPMANLATQMPDNVHPGSGAAESKATEEPPMAKPTSQIPGNVHPGSGAQDFGRRLPSSLTPSEPTEGYRRKRVRKKKKQGRGGPKLKRIRNFALIVVFFFMIAGILYLMQQGLNSGFLGGISVSKSLQGEQAP